MEEKVKLKPRVNFTTIRILAVCSILFFLSPPVFAKPKDINQEIVIIELKEAKLGEWAWQKRRVLAQVIQDLSSLRSRAIVVTMACPEATSQGADQELVKNSRNAGNVYFSVLFDPVSVWEDKGMLNADKISVPLWSDLFSVAGGIGHLNLRQKAESLEVPLSINYQNRLYPALSLLVATGYLNIPASKLKLPLADNVTAYLDLPKDYTKAFNVYSPEQIHRFILSRRTSRIFKDKICIVGVSAQAGVQAAALSNILQMNLSAIRFRGLKLNFLTLVLLIFSIIGIFLLIRIFIRKIEPYFPDIPERIGNFEFGFKQRFIQRLSNNKVYFNFIDYKDGRCRIIMADSFSKGKATELFYQKLFEVFRLQSTDSSLEITAKSLNQLLRGAYKDLFINLICFELDSKLRLMRFISAGFEPIIRFNAGKKDLHILGSDDTMPLGISDGASFHQEEVVLGPSDILVFFNSGITRARNNSGELFGIEEVKSAISQAEDLSPQDLAKDILKHVLHFNQAKVKDKMMILAVRVN